jgi:hypothetical protein
LPAFVLTPRFLPLSIYHVPCRWESVLMMFRVFYVVGNVFLVETPAWRNVYFLLISTAGFLLHNKFQPFGATSGSECPCLSLAHVAAQFAAPLAASACSLRGS